MTASIGIVAIGRNEGERLRACLASVAGAANVARVVYVDSGSTDASVALARQMGAGVVELDLSVPFTAARARNEGFDRLLAENPGISLVQFVDGDCEIVAGWIERAAGELATMPKAAVVCGRRRERFPEKTIYNKLCDIEWNTPVGQARACGGDAMIRVEAFKQIGGFNPGVIAGEEPEMCVRLREQGWTIHRIDAEMTLHDAAMTRFGQWWKRNLRAGHAYAEGFTLHGLPPERMNARSVRSNWIWGLLVPLLAFGFAWPTHGLSVLLFALYPLLMFRVYRGKRLSPSPRKGERAGVRGFLSDASPTDQRPVQETPLPASPLSGERGQSARESRRETGSGKPDAEEGALTARDARLYAFFIVLGKVPQAMGQLQYHFNRLTGRRARIIEYKGPPLRTQSEAAEA